MTDLWQAPFRPFFLLAGIAAVAGALPWAFPGATDDPVGLHARAFLQVWVGFAAAGYLLTAAPHWTGRPPLCGVRLPLLAFVGGAAGVAAFALPDGAARFVHLVFCAGLGLALRGPMAAGRRVIALAPWGLGALPFLLDATGQVLVVTALIALIGGAAVPGFLFAAGGRVSRSRIWNLVPPAGILTAVALRGTALPIAAALLVTVGGVQVLRLAFWLPRQHWDRPALTMLRLGWLWHGGGLVLVGLSLVDLGLAPSVAIHALSVGGMGTMVLALAGRAAMARTPLGLRPRGLLRWAVGLICLAALLRLMAMPLAASWVWGGGWIAFLVALRPALTGTPPHPVLSARRPPHSA